MLIEGNPEVLFAPKTPGAFGGLDSSLKSDLPTNWSSYSPAQKIAYFNENLITPDELLSSGVSQSDIDWMQSNGYDVQKIETKLATEAKLKADFEAARAAEAAAAERAAAEAARIAAEKAAAAEAAKPVMVGNVVLPSDFSSYTAAQKIKFFNNNSITPEQLLQAGVSQSDIDWMLQNGYMEAKLVIDSFVFVKNETKETEMPVKIGTVTLPTDWETYTAAQKIAFFNKNSITEKMLLDAGVSIDDITWMKSHGYTGKSVLTNATQAATQNSALPLIIAAAAAYLIGG